MPITQRAYEQAQQAGGAEGFDPNAFQGGDAGQQKADDGVVDAEFTEVKMTKIICLFKKTARNELHPESWTHSV